MEVERSNIIAARIFACQNILFNKILQVLKNTIGFHKENELSVFSFEKKVILRKLSSEKSDKILKLRIFYPTFTTSQLANVIITH